MLRYDFKLLYLCAQSGEKDSKLNILAENIQAVEVRLSDELSYAKILCQYRDLITYTNTNDFLRYHQS